MSLPVLAIIRFIHSQFTVAERAISRDGELEADKNGAAINGPLALISALIKFSYFSIFWKSLRNYNVEKLNEGIIYNNLSLLYAEMAKIEYEKMSFEDVYQDLLGSHTSHPIDSHPSVKQRMAFLGVQENLVNKELLFPSETSLTNYFDNTSEIDESVSIMEHKIMVGSGMASIPKDEQVA